jgi:hypothetical protein
MTEAVVVFRPGTVDTAAEAVCVVLESHMVGFTDAAKRQFVKRVCKLVRERPLPYEWPKAEDFWP